MNDTSSVRTCTFLSNCLDATCAILSDLIELEEFKIKLYTINNYISVKGNELLAKIKCILALSEKILTRIIHETNNNNFVTEVRDKELAAAKTEITMAKR